MDIVFRVDSSSLIGSGHVVRCLTLAKVLRGHGAHCVFICRDHVGKVSDKIIASGFPVHLLPNNKCEPDLLEAISKCESWLGCSWQMDANQTNEILKAIHPDWLIVDHYSLDQEWEISLIDSYDRLMVIDDLADRKHTCDILLDQNLYSNLNIRYEDKINHDSRQLLGPKYALLQPEYEIARKNSLPRKGPIKELVIFFGGASDNNLTELTLLALKDFATTFATVNVVLAGNSPHFSRVQSLIEPMKNTNLYSDIPSLAKLMSKADLAIGAGGSATWERFCLGLPAIVVTLAENQRVLNRELNEAGLVKLLGDATTIGVEDIRGAISEVLLDVDYEAWSVRSMQVCSGEGAGLVANTILGVTNRIL